MKASSLLLTAGLVGCLLSSVESVLVRPRKSGGNTDVGQSRVDVLWSDWWLKKIIGKHVRGRDLYESDVDHFFDVKTHNYRNWLYVHMYEGEKMVGYGLRISHKLMVTADSIAEKMIRTKLIHVWQDDLPRVWSEKDKLLPGIGKFSITSDGNLANILGSGLSMVKFNQSYSQGTIIPIQDAWKPEQIHSRPKESAEKYRHFDMFTMYAYRRLPDEKTLQFIHHYIRLLECPEEIDVHTGKRVSSNICRFKMAMLGSEDALFCEEDAGATLLWPQDGVSFVAIRPVTPPCSVEFYAGKYWVIRDKLKSHALSGGELTVL